MAEQWNRVNGAITRDGGITTFHLEAWGPEGGRWAQRCEIDTPRLDEPGTYARVLDQMTRDIAGRIS